MFQDEYGQDAALEIFNELADFSIQGGEMTHFSSRTWVSEFAAIMVYFILSVTVFPCTAAWGQDGWKKIENKYFSFSIPSSFKKIDVQPIDSFVEEYVTERIVLSFDYGMYSNNFLDWPEDTKFEYLKVNGKHARIGTATHEFRKGFPYSTQIYIKLSGRTALSMHAVGKLEEDVVLARDIFKTISIKRSFWGIMDP